MSEEALWRKIIELERVIQELRTREVQKWVYPYDARWVGTAGSPLTSTAWDGDSRSTTAKTIIDMSVVFGVPAGVKAVYVRTSCHDDASASGDYFLILSPNSTANSGLATRVSGLPNAGFHDENFTVPCNADGDIYFQIAASGASSFDAYLQVWGYLL